MGTKNSAVLQRGGQWNESRKTLLFEALLNKICRVFDVVAAAMLFVLMVQNGADVIGRYFFNAPMVGANERGQLLLGMMVFLSWGYTQIKKGHVTVDLFLMKFSPRVQSGVNLATTFLTFLFFALVVWQGTIAAWKTHVSGEVVYVIHWPLAPFQFFAPLGALFVCLVLILEMIQHYSKLAGEK
jgi:TRAP-type transport system small permease protein